MQASFDPPLADQTLEQLGATKADLEADLDRFSEQVPDGILRPFLDQQRALLDLVDAEIYKRFGKEIGAL